jgi:glycosyltransferase involved in cell wall biosynthesis
MADRYDTVLVTGTETDSEGSLRDQAAGSVRLCDLPSLRRGIDPPRDLVAVLRLRRLLRDLQPDIVHTHSSKAGIIGRLAALRTGAQLVHTVHGWGHTPADPRSHRLLFVGLERSMAWWTDALIAVSEDVRAEGETCRIGRPDQYVVIPELVDLDRAQPDFAAARRRARQVLGLEAFTGPVIGWVGRFVPQKDPDALADVLVSMLGQEPAACAVLVGDGPLRGQIEQRIATAGLVDRVIFAGLRPDARGLIAAMDVVLHPSLWEGQPRVVQEALAERVPVVATDVAGVAQLICNGRNGFVVRAGDRASMASRGVEVLRAAGLRPPLTDAAVANLIEVAGAERCLARHDALYTRLLAARA